MKGLLFLISKECSIWSVAQDKLLSCKYLGHSSLREVLIIVGKHTDWGPYGYCADRCPCQVEVQAVVAIVACCRWWQFLPYGCISYLCCMSPSDQLAQNLLEVNNLLIITTVLLVMLSTAVSPT